MTLVGLALGLGLVAVAFRIAQFARTRGRFRLVFFAGLAIGTITLVLLARALVLLLPD